MFKVGLLLAVSAAAQKGYPDNLPDFSFCPRKLQAIYADMHDGDKKEITISGTRMTIKPSGNNQTWEVESVVDQKSCSASIDFNVPGKPNPPPVPLQAAMWYSVSHKGKKTVFEFTDPSGTLAPKESKDFPLNHWVEDCMPFACPENVMPFVCPDHWHAVYADMHDGDKKEMIISGTSLTIRPGVNNGSTWEVVFHVDPATCSASFYFNVPGKPGPPPVNLWLNLQATVVHMVSATTQKTEVEFTDPSGTLAPPTVPLNHWVEICHSTNCDRWGCPPQVMSGSDIAV